MTAEQVNHLLVMLGKIAEKLSMQPPYTISGAADWPILAFVGGGLASVIVTLIAFMWLDLRSVVKEHRGLWRDELDRHDHNNKEQIDHLWAEIRRCQEDCCPPRGER